MNEFIKMIKDDVLDKGQLVLKRHEYINLDKMQAQFVAKLFDYKQIDHSRLQIVEVASALSIPQDAAEALIKGLVANNNVGVVNENGEFRFNFNILINKLIESYITPNSSATTDEKLDWTIKTLGFDLTDSNINDLRLIINENGWDNLSRVINKLVSMEDSNWHQLISMYETLGTKEKSDENHLKDILDLNWLEN